jgi:2-dehydro-3-deoxygalactonokinase
MKPGLGDFLSCDWGTTSLRLRWVNSADLTILRELREPVGIKSLHEEAVRTGATGEARAEMFARCLGEKLDALLAGAKPPSRPLPLMISGMASSSVGWREVPYAQAPFPLNGRGVRSEELQWNKPTWVGPTRLVSGVATEHEMMRGEESEIIGLMAEPTLSAHRERCLLILPGTHSKHVRIEHDAVVDWRTFMTGELFEVLGRHSLLRASLDLESTSTAPKSPVDRAAFGEGVQWAQEQGLSGGLFRVRTRAVLGQRPAAENTWFFSGLLIGAELSGLTGQRGNAPVLLAAAPGLAEPYVLALEIIAGQSVPWTQVPAEQVERATIAAHALLLWNY